MSGRVPRRGGAFAAAATGPAPNATSGCDAIRPQRRRCPRRSGIVGRLLAALALWLPLVAAYPVGETPDDLLLRADHLKTANNSEFQALLQQLDALAPQWSPTQREYVGYLHVWQSGYLGKYEDALADFRAFLASARDPTMRARAQISLVNVQVNATHYEEAYATLDELLATVAQTQDRTAHFLSQTVAATLYGDAGQRDLALRYADQALAFDDSDRSACIAYAQRAAALSRSGELQPDDISLRDGLDACVRIDDVLYANVFRAWKAQALIAAGRGDEALHLLEAHDAEMLGTHSAAATSLFRSLLARCQLLAGDIEKASVTARSAIDSGIKQAYSKSVADAYEVLYEATRKQGHFEEALDYYEKYARADKAYLDDAGARTLAFRMAAQQALDKKRQIDSLNDKNRLLQLQGEVATRTAEAERLYILLLICAALSIGLWAYRTRHSQRKFQLLSRHDGLTGILNRQHFIDDAKATLRYCARSGRDASLILIDLDEFKAINDTHGHIVGDGVLKQASAACQAHMRSIDLFGRIGGEEFGVLMPEASIEAAVRRAEELRTAIADTPGAEIRISASFGVSSTRQAGYDLRKLLIYADSALYGAKRGGRNRVERYDERPAAGEEQVTSW